MDTEQKQEVQVRWMMIGHDMPEVLEIEKESFVFSWLEEDFLRCLNQRNCTGMVATCFDIQAIEKVVGFVIYELYKDGIHVLSFAVHPDFRRQGIGSQMIEKLIDMLLAGGKSRIMLAVRETNTDAQLFFRKNGFKAIFILRNYYEDTPEDAYCMQLQIVQLQIITDDYRYETKITKLKKILAESLAKICSFCRLTQ